MSEFKSWQSYRSFAHEVIKCNRFIKGEDVSEFLAALRETSKKRIKKIGADTPLWRAQLGCDYRPFEENGEILFDEEVPYSEDRMKPLSNRAKEGRANPKGIPYLYVATKRKTALSEVRPWLGSILTLAIFKTVRELQVVDCSVHGNSKTPFYLGGEPSPEVREEIVWKHIDNAFSRPVTQSDDTAEYIPTQVIAELFKNQGLDGLYYKSNLDSGLNIALFDLNSAEFERSCLFRTGKIELVFEECSPTIIRYKRNA